MAEAQNPAEGIPPHVVAQQPRAFEFEGHVLTELRDQDPATVTVGPQDDGRQRWAELAPDQHDLAGSNYTRMVDHREETGLIPPLPADPLPARGRAPVYYEPQGYVEVNASGAADRLEDLPPGSQYVTSDQFERFANNFKRDDGKFVAMTAYGAVPVPDELMKDVPERFITRPIFEEKETFVMKKKRHDRVTEKPFTQHQHHFVEVVKKGVVDKVIPAGEQKKVVIPRYFYKAIVAENIIEVPQGTKYTETAIDVHMRHPPKLVPVRKAIVVQRNIECTKPVVQEKIIERPKIVKRSVPQVVTKEIPFIVPKYVEKIVEVPFRPGMQLPPQTGEIKTNLPSTPQGAFSGGHYQRTPGGWAGGQTPLVLGGSPVPGASYGGTPLPGPGATPGFVTDEISIAAGARVEGDTLFFGPAQGTQPQTVYIPPGVKELKFPYEAKVDVSVVQADEMPPPPHLLFGGPMGQHGAPHTGQPESRQMGQPEGPQMGQPQPQWLTPHHSGAPSHSGAGSRSGVSGSPQPGHSAHPAMTEHPMYATQSQQGAAGQIPTAMPPALNYAGHPGAAGTEGSDAGGGCCPKKVPGFVNYDVPLPPPPRRKDPNAAYVAPMDPVIMHDVPGMRNIEYHAQSYEPRVLTKSGVTKMSRLGCCVLGDPATRLYPPLSSNVPAPIEHGQLDFEELERIQEDYRSKLNPSIVDAMEKQQARRKSEGAAPDIPRQ
eukprot:Gregarina_sp_Poly_1__2745@NODE_175_length_12037_cov_139_596324_g155_i0_p3_GENE_NODE_175_length_12037_cov_139_596324_g155_i0NODE_175_length_12037_cov_139_596324_g155_i0_p3_ORF_typecomplete_len714_score97_44IMCp/PF12314_8/39IMCp/PF12314_8/5_9IMCp/PF12314_8/1_5_NODE_175_length_12037_cov_139_596324_g155_i0945311594